jgi:hypothetical protein
LWSFRRFLFYRYGNQVPLVFLPDGSSQVVNPLSGEVGPGPICLVQECAGSVEQNSDSLP